MISLGSSRPVINLKCSVDAANLKIKEFALTEILADTRKGQVLINIVVGHCEHFPRAEVFPSTAVTGHTHILRSQASNCNHFSTIQLFCMGLNGLNCFYSSNIIHRINYSILFRCVQ